MSERKHLPKIGKTTYHIESITGNENVFCLSSDVDYDIKDLAVIVNGKKIQDSGRVEIRIDDGA